MSQTLLEADEPAGGLFIPNTVKAAERWVGERIRQGRPFLIRGNSSSSSRDPYENSSLKTGKLSTRKLRKTLFFDPDDLVAGMQAGQTAAELQQLLAQKKMQLMVNPWYPDSTLGGMVSANISGPNRMNMGGLRDSLIGIEYINGRGELVKAGGKVVKNVTGYDLTRMMIGHLGGLGLITSVNFKVQPFVIDPHALFLETDLQNWQNAVGLLQSRRIPLDWMQAVSASAEGNRILLGAGFSGNPERRSRIVNELKDVFGEKSFILADDDDSPEWPCLPGKERFNGFLPAYLEHWQINQPGLHLQASLPTADILELSLESLSAWDPRMIIHPVGGDLHLFLGEQDGDRQKKFIQTFLKCLPRQSSNIRMLRSSKQVGVEQLGHFAKPPGYSLSCRLKQHLDPEELFDAPYYRM